MIFLKLRWEDETVVDMLLATYNNETRRMWMRAHNKVLMLILNLDGQKASKLFAYVSEKKPVCIKHH